MSNPPIPMLYRELSCMEPKEVLVYDFMHDTQDTFQTLAVCWVPSIKSWLTINIAALTPIVDKKKTLNEDKDNGKQ